MEIPKKAAIIACLMTLAHYSDEEHPLSTSEIIKHMSDDFGLELCRQSVAEYLKIYEMLGIEIGEIKRKYYYDDRELQNEEVEVLCHSIMANNTIPLSYSKELINKLKKTQGPYFAKNKNLDFNIFNIDKRNNKEIYMNIATISKAIDEGRKISFDYYHYDHDKRSVKSREERYKVIPCRTVSVQSRFYLVTYSEKYKDYVHYRIDKMKDVRIEEKMTTIYKIDPYQYTRHRLYMQAGEIKDYTLEVKSNIIDELIDQFGIDINIEKKEEDKYIAKVKTTEQAMIYFALQFITYLKVIRPIEMKEKIKGILRDASRKYEEI